MKHCCEKHTMQNSKIYVKTVATAKITLEALICGCQVEEGVLIAQRMGLREGGR